MALAPAVPGRTVRAPVTKGIPAARPVVRTAIVRIETVPIIVADQMPRSRPQGAPARMMEVEPPRRATRGPAARPERMRLMEAAGAAVARAVLETAIRPIAIVIAAGPGTAIIIATTAVIPVDRATAAASRKPDLKSSKGLCRKKPGIVGPPAFSILLSGAAFSRRERSEPTDLHVARRIP